MNRKSSVVLGLGSNLGRKSANLCTAIKYLSSFCSIVKVSSVYKTASLLHDDQDAYFNLCVLIETELQPEELYRNIKNIEKRMGRTSTGRWYTRVIDIDIIDYKGQIIKSDLLDIPHKGMAERSFVLYPLMDILPDYTHPESCQSIENMVKMIRDNLGIIKLGVPVWQL